jgi:hypothetical protein
VIARGNTLTSLAGLLGGVQNLFIALMIGAYVTTPQAVPGYLAVLDGAHFLPFAWLYDSGAYVFCAVATVAAAGLSAWMLPAATYVVTPFAVAVVLAVTAALLARQSAAVAGERADHAEEPTSHRAA